MPTPAEVLMDREQYPDDLEFDWMGEKHTLKTWRTQILPMREFTQVRQQATAKIQELEQTQLTLQQQLAAALQQRQAQGPDNAPADDDPYIAPLRQDIRSLQQAIVNLRNERVEEQRTMQLNTWWSQIGELKRQNPELDQEGLIRFAAAEGLRDMHKAYRLMTYDNELKAAETRGFEKGKKTVPPAYVPGGRRGSSAGAVTDRVVATSTQEAMVNALHDPDVQAALHGEEVG